MTQTPNASTLMLDADHLNAFMLRAFPGADPALMGRVVALQPGRMQVMQPYNAGSLRPGGVISGPTMMALADTTAYYLVLAHIGEVPMAVTTSLTIHFLRPCKPGDLHADASLLRLGRRIATSDIRIWTESPDKLAAHATVAYAIPQ
jgi:uncharacterized protein (TIGR00369 family)